MKLDEIRQKWVSQNKDFEAVKAMWDSQAQSSSFNKQVTVSDNSFLQLMLKKDLLKSEYDVLDIGCGAAAYTLAISDYVHSATGVDISPNMIQKGEEKRLELGIENVHLSVENWSAVTLDQLSFFNKFDVVFAHMSPAVSCASTLEKMIDASKKHCLLCKPTRRFDPVFSVVEEIVGIQKDEHAYDESMVHTFELLWHLGYSPEFFYEKQVWNIERSYEDACGFYINRAKQSKALSELDVESAKRFLKSIEQDGVIKETIETLITTVYWQK